MLLLGRALLSAVAGLTLSLASPLSAQMEVVSFFVAVEGAGWGADSPALQVSDQHCRDLAYNAGLGDGSWRAYLDGVAEDGEGDEVAKDRIGTGPWINYYGVVVAEDVDQLHSDASNLTLETAITVTGEYVPDGSLVIPDGVGLDGALFSREGPFFCFRLPD